MSIEQYIVSREVLERIVIEYPFGDPTHEDVFEALKAGGWRIESAGPKRLSIMKFSQTIGRIIAERKSTA